MAFSATISLVSGGVNTGPFDLYSNTDSYTSAFASGISLASMITGYVALTVPTSTTTCRVKSAGECTNYVDIVIS